MIEIRALKNDDNLNDLIPLSKEFFLEYEANHSYFFKTDRINKTNIVSYFSNFIDNENRKAFIAIDNNMIIGYISVLIQNQSSYWAVKKIGHISGFMVNKNYRRKGIGIKLLDNAIDYFGEKSVRNYTVYTSVNNIGAIEFYKRKGMEPLYTTLLGKIESE